MNNYKYKLQNVLNFKSSIEKEMISNYNKDKNILEKEEEKLEDYYLLKRSIEKEKNEVSLCGTINELITYNKYIEEVKIKINLQKEKIVRAKKQVAITKEKLLIASKDKKTFQKLKENDYEKHTEEEKKKEAIKMDEIVTFINCNS